MSGWNWKRWPWTRPKRVEVELGAGLTGMSREQARCIADQIAPELRAKNAKEADNEQGD